MAEPDNLILALLRELRSDIGELRRNVDRRFDGVDREMSDLKKKVENIRQAAFGESVLGRYAAAEVEERLDAIEKRLDSLEQR